MHVLKKCAPTELGEGRVGQPVAGLPLDDVDESWRVCSNVPVLSGDWTFCLHLERYSLHPDLGAVDAVDPTVAMMRSALGGGGVSWFGSSELSSTRWLELLESARCGVAAGAWISHNKDLFVATTSVGEAQASLGHDHLFVEFASSEPRGVCGVYTEGANAVSTFCDHCPSTYGLDTLLLGLRLDSNTELSLWASFPGWAIAPEKEGCSHCLVQSNQSGVTTIHLSADQEGDLEVVGFQTTSPGGHASAFVALGPLDQPSRSIAAMRLSVLPGHAGGAVIEYFQISDLQRADENGVRLVPDDAPVQAARDCALRTDDISVFLTSGDAKDVSATAGLVTNEGASSSTWDPVVNIWAGTWFSLAVILGVFLVGRQIATRGPDANA